MDDQSEREGPQDAETSKGPNAKAAEAIALLIDYRRHEAAGKRNRDTPADGKSARMASARNRPPRARAREMRSGLGQVAYRDSAGRKWAYSGKRGRVLTMLASGKDGVTQRDTLQWHTRLGGTIHILRRDGLVMDTEREGEFRLARYRLRTPGTLIIQPNNRQGAGDDAPGKL
jgi:hypothetical protein